MTPLTKVQAKYLAFIVFFIETRGFPPVIRDIGSYFGVSTNAVVCINQRLMRKGYIEVSPHTARGIRLTEAYKLERADRIEQWRKRKTARAESRS